MTREQSLPLIYAAAFFRSVGVGFLGVVLGIYLARIGFSATLIGATVAWGLAGAVLATMLVSYRADLLGRRVVLVSLALLSCAGAAGLMLVHTPAAMFGIAFVGMVNGTGTDRSPSYALEQAILPGLLRDELRTSALAWYSLDVDAAHALGALAGGLPVWLMHRTGMELTATYHYAFGAYLAVNVGSAVLYALLPAKVERTAASRAAPQTVSPETRRVVRQISSLFAIDALGGGFLTDAIVTYWFFRRFGLSEAQLAPLFAIVHVLNALSYPVAARLAKKIGLINTMVFTHIPSSLFLIAVPFAPSAGWAAGLFLAREALVEMDVPTRQSYVMAAVKPHERIYASGITNMTRNVAWAVGPSLAGAFMQRLALASPLWIGGGVKIVYDLLLYRSFSKRKPPEEASSG